MQLFIRLCVFAYTSILEFPGKCGAEAMPRYSSLFPPHPQRIRHTVDIIEKRRDEGDL